MRDGREGGIRSVYGARKKFDTPIGTDREPADSPAAIAGSGRAALNRFGRVIAIPPLRFHATFAATSADLPRSPCPRSLRSRLVRPAAYVS